MSNQVLRIGEVIEVRGQKIRAEIYSEKNTSSLLYDGEIIRNVSVGSYVKITKGYSSIIGRIEGEYISEANTLRNVYTRKSERIVRIIEISIVGTLKDKFNHGISEMPLVGNEVYILIENEVQSIFAFSSAKSGSIQVGEILGYSDYKLNIDVNKIFASHIGIFGNTGSGKSNTLANIYTSLFNAYSKMNDFTKKSRFIFLDFNGEFENAITTNKKYYSLSTRSIKSDRYPIREEFILNEEFWSIITEATAKTQSPFIDRSLKSMKRSLKEKNINKELICSVVRELILSLFENPTRYQQLKRPIIDLLFEGFDVKGINLSLHLGQVGYHSKNTCLFVPSEGLYFDTQEKFNDYMQPVLDLLIQERLRTKNTNMLQVFKFFMTLQFVTEVFNGISNEEHIAPLLKRFKQRYNDVDKVFNVVSAEKLKVLQKETNVEVISLVDVNIKMRKTIPLLVCKQAYDYQKQQFKQDSSLHIVVDEAHNILSFSSERESSLWKDYRLEVFEEIIKEGRKFGVFMTISSQRPSDISPTLISQLHNYFLHRLVNNEDIRAIGKTISFLDAVSFEMIPILPQGACILTGTAMNFPIVVQMELLPEEDQPNSKTVGLTSLWRE